MYNTVSRLKPEGDRKARRGGGGGRGLHTVADANGRGRVIDSESQRSATGALVMV